MFYDRWFCVLSLCCYCLFRMIFNVCVPRRRFLYYMYRSNSLYCFTMRWSFWDEKKGALHSKKKYFKHNLAGNIVFIHHNVECISSYNRPFHFSLFNGEAASDSHISKVLLWPPCIYQIIIFQSIEILMKFSNIFLNTY